jgi:DNA-binding winged helix-turn-helix (wHTH) protein
MRQEGVAVGEVYRAKGVEVRADERRLPARGVPVSLGARAFDVLLALIEQRDRVVGKNEVLVRVWPGVVVEENNFTVQVSSLRKALGAQAIATAAGRGYRFTLPLLDDSVAPELASPRQHPVVAVLPFDNLSNEPEMQFLLDGGSEEVIQCRWRRHGWASRAACD